MEENLKNKGVDMNVEEWKKELTKKTEGIISEYKGMVVHIDLLEGVEGDFDEDEIGAFMLIKLNKMNKTIEKLSEA